jgi:hypothetical protein
MARLLYWGTFLVTVIIYAVMLIWTIPSITSEAGGHAIFDMRPGGYTFAEAHEFLDALSERGKYIYLERQHLLDMVYPAVLCITLFWSIYALTPRRWGVWRYILPAPAIPGMFFDYMENLATRGLLITGPDHITVAMVERASLWSRIKATSVTLAFIILIVLLARWVFLRLRKAQARA